MIPAYSLKPIPAFSDADGAGVMGKQDEELTLKEFTAAFENSYKEILFLQKPDNSWFNASTTEYPGNRFVDAMAKRYFDAIDANRHNDDKPGVLSLEEYRDFYDANLTPMYEFSEAVVGSGYRYPDNFDKMTSFYAVVSFDWNEADL